MPADAEMYSIDITTAKATFEAVHWLQGEAANGSWRRPAALLIKVDQIRTCMCLGWGLQQAPSVIASTDPRDLQSRSIHLT